MQISLLALLFVFQSYAGIQHKPVTQSLTLAACQQTSPESADAVAANIIYRSTDGGQTWEDLSEGLPENLNVWSVFASGDNVYLGSEKGLYHSTTPPVMEPWNKESFLGDPISDIFPGKKGLYASSFGIGFFQNIAGTDLWRPMHNTLKDRHIRSVVEMPDGTLFVACDSGVFKSSDAGETWKHVFDQYMIMSLVATDGVLVAAGVGGLLRSTDNGEHWDNVLSEDGRVQKAELFDGRIFAITRGSGSYQEVRDDPEHMANRLRISSDQGKTWQRMDQSLSTARLMNAVVEDLAPVWSINDIKQAGSYLFCSLDSGIFRSADGGKTWKLMLPVKNRMSFRLAVSGKTIFAVIGGGC